jgi:hypothetical protein
MTLEQLITLYRADTKDEVLPYFCEPELLAIYANEAQDEACRRGQLIRDSVSSVCTIAYAQGASSVPVSSKIVAILRARIDGHIVRTVSVDAMDEVFPGWEVDTTQTRPTHLVSGESDGVLMLWPKPAEAGSIKLTVLRLPINRLENDNDTPEIREESHVALVNWMMYRAYSRADSDLYDERKAATALARFEAEFGRKASARNEQWVRNGAGVMPDPIA